MPYKVFCPRIKKVRIKDQGKVYLYEHGQIVPDESAQGFFVRYPHIFFPEAAKPKARTKAVKKVEPKPLPVSQPEPKITVEEFFDKPIFHDLPELKLEKVSKGWYIVTDGSDQVYPKEAGKKTRKKTAEKFINENS